MAQESAKGFVLYYDYRQHLALLTDEERGKLLMALLNYGEAGTAPELDGATMMAFSFIAGQIDRDARKYQEIAKKRSESGKKGGRPPKSGKDQKAEESKKSNSFSDEANQSEESYTNTNTSTNKNTNTSTSKSTSIESPSIPQGGKESDGDDPTFDHFWDRYPKQVGKAAAEEEWRKIPKGVTLAEIMIGLERAKKNPEWIREGGRYIPNPAKWIKERRWNDEPASATEAAAQRLKNRMTPPTPGGFDTMGVLQQIIAEEEAENHTPF